jgi:hypothetical protein
MSLSDEASPGSTRIVVYLPLVRQLLIEGEEVSQAAVVPPPHNRLFDEVAARHGAASDTLDAQVGAIQPDVHQLHVIADVPPP